MPSENEKLNCEKCNELITSYNLEKEENECILQLEKKNNLDKIDELLKNNSKLIEEIKEFRLKRIPFYEKTISLLEEEKKNCIDKHLIRSQNYLKIIKQKDEENEKLLSKLKDKEIILSLREKIFDESKRNNNNNLIFIVLLFLSFSLNLFYMIIGKF